MRGLKITPADRWFSKCIREASDWTCVVCLKKYPENSQALHCSHYFSRRHNSIRHDPENAVSMCFGCHSRLGGDPDDFRSWMVFHSGEDLVTNLRAKRNDTALAKLVKKNQKLIATHFQAEYARLKDLRAAGAVGQLEIRGFFDS